MLYVTGLDGQILVVAITVVGQAIDGDEERVAAARRGIDAGFDVLPAGGVLIIEDVEGAKEKPIFGFLGERPTRAVWRRRG